MRLISIFAFMMATACSTTTSTVIHNDNPNMVNDLGITTQRAAEIDRAVDSIMTTLSLDEKFDILMGTSGRPKLDRGEAITGLNIDGATTLPADRYIMLLEPGVGEAQH